MKLPRKRKKAFIKHSGRSNYIAFIIISEILFEEKGVDDNRFPKYEHVNGENIQVGFW